ncbi:MAG: hypothetical protein KA974_07605 [Saprospiraceae bacterium]|nr:hypothetical protein [Saprospiraceae bacterium]MBP7679676.1 hypothetical protein [Saprospiraceae bacterium]
MTELYNILRPETSLERYFLTVPEFIAGLYWGEPRFGHPEGKVLYHIRDVLDNIDKLLVPNYIRQQLRLVAFLHDTFKINEERNMLEGNPYVHHGTFARQFAVPYIADPFLLDVVELHDEAYYCWRLGALHKQAEAGELRFEALYNRVGQNMQFYYYFFKCDTCTGDKILAPLRWFEQSVADIEKVYW